jgi:hypothetical protein
MEFAGGGIELSRCYFEELVSPLLREILPEVRYAAARVWSGSEVLGLDDAMSRDHDWGLRLQVFVPDSESARVESALDQHLPEPALDGRPVALELVLRRHLLRPEVRAELGRLGADRLLEDVGERVRRVRREHDRAQAGGRAAARCGRGDGRLADTALARVEDRARGHRQAPQPTSRPACGASD